MGSYRPQHDEVARVTLGRETETPSGWTYEATIVWPEGVEGEYRVTLSWADHDHISGGVNAPSQVVEALLAVLVRVLDAEEVPARLDLSTMRRVVEDLDERVRARL
ncbi:MAG: hypothetical protein ACIARR_00590 [Phycisphaerales bacterium JB059]